MDRTISPDWQGHLAVTDQLVVDVSRSAIIRHLAVSFADSLGDLLGQL